MVDQVSHQARRRFLRLVVAGAATASLCGGLVARRAWAQERVQEDEQLAQQLGYTHDASQVDKSQWPTYEQGQTCANCQLFQAQEGAEWGPCAIFGGRLVHAPGWCSSWVERGA